MGRLGFMYSVLLNLKGIVSFKTIAPYKQKAYQPNKGIVKIWCDFLRDTLKYGCPERGYWMYGFYDKSAQEQSHYVNYEQFATLRNKLNMHPRVTYTTGLRYNYLCILRDKFVFSRFLSALGFPTPEDYFVIDGLNNQLMPVNLHSTKSGGVIDSLLNQNFDGFCKIISGECGKSVFPLKCENGKLSGEVSSIEELKKIVGHSQFIVQQRLTQHPVISGIYPNSINTMRLITILCSDGDVNLLPAILRFGTHGNTVDNWAAGGLVVAIDSEGHLRGNGRYEFPVENKMQETIHPDTMVKFDGIKIPYYKEAVEMTKRLHRFFYGIPCIGWDIAFTENGPVFIEGNDNFEITLNQAVHGGLKKEWESAVSKV